MSVKLAVLTGSCGCGKDGRCVNPWYLDATGRC